MGAGLGSEADAAANFDEKVGTQIIEQALRIPCSTIAKNAGAEGAVVVGKLLEGGDSSVGYNAATGEYVDMVAAGVLDPLKVVRTALTDAASVASLVMTSEAIVVEAPKPEGAPGPPEGMAGGKAEAWPGRGGPPPPRGASQGTDKFTAIGWRTFFRNGPGFGRPPARYIH